MNLTAIQAEVQARGFDHLSTTRLNYFINRAYHRICEAEDWIWLRTTTSGTMPLTISDLRSVLSVVNTTTDFVLCGMDERTLLEMGGDLTTSGTALYFYRTSDTALAVYPTDSSNFSVTYIKVPTDLSAGGNSDTPVVPTRYHYLIVDLAVVEALKDMDNIAEAASLEQNAQALIQEMRLSYAYNHAGPDYQVASGQDY